MPEQVQILEDRTLNQPLPNGAILQMTEIVYQAHGLPPRRVFLPKAEHPEAARAAAIKADLDAARTTRPTLLNIP